MKYLLAANFSFGGVELKAGKDLDDGAIDVAALQQAGAILVPYPLTPEVLRIVEELRKQQLKGRKDTELYILHAALSQVALSGGGGGGVPPTRTLTAGAGLTGGGDLSADRTFNVVANPDGSIIVNPNDVKVGVLATDAQHGARGGGGLHAIATTSVAGFMSAADKLKLDGLVPSVGGPSFIAFGNEKVGATTTTRYLSPYNDGDVIASTQLVQFQAPQGGTLKRLVVRHGVPAGNGNNIVYTVRINGVATFLAVTLASTSFAAVDATNTVLFAANDLIDVMVTKIANIGASPTNVIASMEIV